MNNVIKNSEDSAYTQDEMLEKIADCEQALTDIANASQSDADRLKFINARANCALLGQKWTREFVPMVSSDRGQNENKIQG